MSIKRKERHLSLLSIGDHDRMGQRKLRFDHRGYEVILRHPPGQRDLDDFHPEDYTVRKRPQRSGTIVWLKKSDSEVGRIDITWSIQGGYYIALPYGGIGPSSRFLGRMVDTLIDEVERWKDHPDPADACTQFHMAQLVRNDASWEAPTRMDVVPKWKRER